MARGFRMGVGGGRTSRNPVIISGNTINYQYMDNGVVVIGTDSVNLYWRGAGYPSAMYIYNVDLTKINTISITCKCGTSDGDFRIEYIGATRVARVLKTGSSIQTVTLDVSAYSGLQTLYFANNYYGTTNIYNMVMN